MAAPGRRNGTLRGLQHHLVPVFLAIGILLASGVSSAGADEATTAPAPSGSPTEAPSAPSESPTSTGGPKTTTDYISGTSSVFGGISKLFSIFGDKSLDPFATGIGALASIALPFISAFWTSSPGPSIQDVLNKLDQMTEQLNQIQNQLAAVQAQIAALQSEVHLGNCSTLIANLNPTLVAINASQRQYQQLIEDATALPTALNATLRASTLDKNFNDFATNVLGSGVSVADSPMGRSIALINTDLLNPGAGLGQGIIQSCAKVGFDNWQTSTAKNAQWLDDRGYSQQIAAFVVSYQNYEVQALNYIEEASYYRATQLLHSEKPSLVITVDQRAKACQLAHQQVPDGSAARLCKNVKAMITSTYNALVDQWKFTGRPYSDGRVVLSLGSKITGASGTKPVLWVRDPSTLPSNMNQGTWDTTTLPNVGISSLTGWKPASLTDWNGLEADWQAVNPTRTDTSPGILGAMRDSKQFGHVGEADRLYWIPGAKASFRWGTGKVDGHPNDTFTYTGPDIAVRCYVSGTSVNWKNGAGVACSQDWWNAYSGQSFTWVKACKYCADVAATYTAPSPGKQFVPAPGPFQAASTTYVVDTAARYCDRYYKYYHVCGLNLKKWNDSPVAMPTGQATPSLTAHLMPALAVPEAAACTNSIGLPKLCTSSGDGYSDSAFVHWVNETIPNPDQPPPAPAGPPTISQPKPNGTQCTAAAWTGTNPTVGAPVPTDTTWTASFSTRNAAGEKTRTVVQGPNEELNPTTMASGGGFRTDQPYQLTCTVSARWANLVNTGTATSSQFQLSPEGGGWVLTQVPGPPVIDSVKTWSHGASLTFTLGPTYGSTIVRFTVTPYTQTSDGWTPQSPIVVGVSPISAHMTISPQVAAGAYRFTVTDNTEAGNSRTPVVGLPSALSDVVQVPAGTEESPSTTIPSTTTPTTTTPATPTTTTPTTTTPSTTTPSTTSPSTTTPSTTTPTTTTPTTTTP